MKTYYNISKHITNQNLSYHIQTYDNILKHTLNFENI